MYRILWQFADTVNFCSRNSLQFPTQKSTMLLFWQKRPDSYHVGDSQPRSNKLRLSVIRFSNFCLGIRSINMTPLWTRCEDFIATICPAADRVNFGTKGFISEFSADWFNACPCLRTAQSLENLFTALPDRLAINLKPHFRFHFTVK